MIRGTLRRERTDPYLPYRTFPTANARAYRPLCIFTLFPVRWFIEVTAITCWLSAIRTIDMAPETAAVETQSKFAWIDLLWLVFLAGLAMLPPIREIHKQLILAGIG